MIIKIMHKKTSNPLVLIICFFLPFFSMAQEQPFLVVLGNVQDGGIPHIGCKEECCLSLSLKEKSILKVTSLAYVDPKESRHYLFEASHDISDQLNFIDQITAYDSKLGGIFLTHAHMGHYSGLLQLGREALGAKGISVYAMPRMSRFLKNNAPWNQLLSLKNIQIKSLRAEYDTRISPELEIRTILVPHRDEFSETVGFYIKGPNKKAFFLPDIDKWDKWEESLENVLSKVDYAFLDGTFFDSAEINHRDISEIPHPFVVETLERLSKLPIQVKKKIFFIHMNHTNAMLDPRSIAAKKVLSEGFQIARFGMQFPF